MRYHIEKGMPVKFWDERPTLFGDLEECWDAFWFLNNTRTHGMNGPEAIKVTELKALYELRDYFEDVDTFIRHIYTLDKEYLRLHNEQVKAVKK